MEAESGAVLLRECGPSAAEDGGRAHVGQRGGLIDEGLAVRREIVQAAHEGLVFAGGVLVEWHGPEVKESVFDRLALGFQSAKELPVDVFLHGNVAHTLVVRVGVGAAREVFIVDAEVPVVADKKLEESFVAEALQYGHFGEVDLGDEEHAPPVAITWPGVLLGDKGRATDPRPGGVVYDAFGNVVGISHGHAVEEQACDSPCAGVEKVLVGGEYVGELEF